MEFLTTTYGLIITAIILLWLLMWFLVPFAIYLIYKNSRKQTELNSEILHELKKLNYGVESIGKEPEAPSEPRPKPKGPPMQPPPPPAVLTCPKCGQKNAGASKLCVQCGIEIKKEPSF